MGTARPAVTVGACCAAGGIGTASARLPIPFRAPSAIPYATTTTPAPPAATTTPPMHRSPQVAEAPAQQAKRESRPPAEANPPAAIVHYLSDADAWTIAAPPHGRTRMTMAARARTDARATPDSPASRPDTRAPPAAQRVASESERDFAANGLDV
ncbi:hypothetical protein AB0C34_30565 [Nocardia sp. NPDC049220]|uniref:hypothetical protein n=1 Tax=Nocardia sp. NPDC049220 TaxID=3155273 RepID=UPI0033FCE7A6